MDEMRQNGRNGGMREERWIKARRERSPTSKNYHEAVSNGVIA